MKNKLKPCSSNQGFVLPIALGMGIMMLLVGVTLIIRSQNSQVNLSARKRTGASLAVAEAGVARTLAQLSETNNKALLTWNYDSINPITDKTYLGPDGIYNNGDEENTAINQWASYAGSGSSCTSNASLDVPNVAMSGTIGTRGQYILKAYRYHSPSQTGTFLIQGQQNSTSLISVNLSINSTASDFPGVLAVEKLELFGRSVAGSNGNVYYDPIYSTNPSLTQFSVKGDTNRPNYLNAIKSGTNDSIVGDRIDGKIVACKLTPTWSNTPPASVTITNVGDISLTNGGAGTTRIFSSSNATPSPAITYIRTGSIDLNNNNRIDINTTNGPVYLYVTNGSLQLNGNAKIRNIRNDGVAPKVGDLRIILATNGQSVQTYGASCIETAFLYVPGGNIQMGGSGDGCTANPGSTNIHGVVWAKSISNTSGDFSGVSIPEDVSSLSDLVNNLGLPNNNKFGSVKGWQRQRL